MTIILIDLFQMSEIDRKCEKFNNDKRQINTLYTIRLDIRVHYIKLTITDID